VATRSAADDASENIDQDGFDMGVLKDNSEPGFDGFGIGSTTHVEEVGGFAAGRV